MPHNHGADRRLAFADSSLGDTVRVRVMGVFSDYSGVVEQGGGGFCLLALWRRVALHPALFTHARRRRVGICRRSLHAALPVNMRQPPLRCADRLHCRSVPRGR